MHEYIYNRSDYSMYCWEYQLFIQSKQGISQPLHYSVLVYTILIDILHYDSDGSPLGLYLAGLPLSLQSIFRQFLTQPLIPNLYLDIFYTPYQQ